jgi:P4 family phage/plasmid primase-like protien
MSDEAVFSHELAAQHHMQSIYLRAESPADCFKDFVETFLEVEPQYYDSETMAWWSWNKKEKKWEMGNEVEILRTFLIGYAIVEWIQPSVRQKIIDILKVCAFVKPKPLPTSWIQFRNKVIDIVTGEEFAATKEYFFTNPIPYDLADESDTPTIDRLFGEWMGEKKDVLYEICAYSMYRAYPIPKIFLLFGVGRNGKSQYLKFLGRLIGDKNVTATSLNLLYNSIRFETLKLMNKLIIQLTELEKREKFPLAVLKQLTGGDLISYEIKRGGTGQFRNFGKIIMATNNMPDIGEESVAVAERFFVIDFRNSFPPSSGDIIDTIPYEEYSRLCRKCVTLLPKIINEGKFSHEGTQEEKFAALRDKRHVLTHFFEEVIQPGKDKYYIDDLFKILQHFCSSKNVVCPDKRSVIFFINKNIGYISSQRTQLSTGENTWRFENLAINPKYLYSHTHFFSGFPLNAHIGTYVENRVKCEYVSMKSPQDEDTLLQNSENDIKTIKDIKTIFKDNHELSWSDIQWTLNESPNETDRFIEHHLSQGIIFECRPGFYRLL